MDIHDERFENLSEDAKAEALGCKTPEEFLDVAKKHGVELSLDELDGVAGGWGDTECRNRENQC